MKLIRGPNPKIFYFLIALCSIIAICVPANAMADQSAHNNMIPAGNSNLAVFQNSNSADILGPASHIDSNYASINCLTSAATRAIPITACMKEGNVYRATNSTWRRSCLNAAQSNSRTYMNTTTGAIEATFPRRISAPLLT